eukprot:Sspe_Gene.5604::Locus_1855_Transcript_1_1_Confidence_1.000_Length_1125::g.5604::m.5604
MRSIVGESFIMVADDTEQHTLPDYSFVEESGVLANDESVLLVSVAQSGEPTADTPPTSPNVSAGPAASSPPTAEPKAVKQKLKEEYQGVPEEYIEELARIVDDDRLMQSIMRCPHNLAEAIQQQDFTSEINKLREEGYVNTTAVRELLLALGAGNLDMVRSMYRGEGHEVIENVKGAAQDEERRKAELEAK